MPATEGPTSVREVANGQLTRGLGPLQPLIDERVKLDRIGEVHAVADQSGDWHGALVRLRSLHVFQRRDLVARGRLRAHRRPRLRPSYSDIRLSAFRGFSDNAAD